MPFTWKLSLRTKKLWLRSPNPPKHRAEEVPFRERCGICLVPFNVGSQSQYSPQLAEFLKDPRSNVCFDGWLLSPWLNIHHVFSLPFSPEMKMYSLAVTPNGHLEGRGSMPPPIIMRTAATPMPTPKCSPHMDSVHTFVDSRRGSNASLDPLTYDQKSSVGFQGSQLSLKCLKAAQVWHAWSAIQWFWFAGTSGAATAQQGQLLCSSLCVHCCEMEKAEGWEVHGKAGEQIPEGEMSGCGTLWQDSECVKWAERDALGFSVFLPNIWSEVHAKPAPWRAAMWNRSQVHAASLANCSEEKQAPSAKSMGHAMLSRCQVFPWSRMRSVF